MEFEEQPLFFLNHQLVFPPVSHANAEGILAVGGDLSPERLMLAYRSGIFPWFNEGDPIIWWSPDPRMVLFPKEVKISKSMKKVCQKEDFVLTKNNCFADVIDACSKVPREGQDGTWISPQMKAAYNQLHRLGYAHSYEVWQDEVLVGGLYGVDLGHIFCGESMFSKVSNASKFAFIKMAQELEQKNYQLIDCQVYTSHLESLGAKEISREAFVSYL